MSAVAAARTRRDRTNHRWNGRKAKLFADVEVAIARLEAYWPLTLRQIYYQLVAAEVLPNARSSYQKLSVLLAEARLAGKLEWRCMEDRSRSLLWAEGWRDCVHFAEDELDLVLTGYRRDLQQSQPVRLEMWVEKDALAHVVYRVAKPWCISVVVAKGWSSMTFKDLCRQRALADPRPTRILYLGDLDPSGWQMLPSMMHCLQVEMRLGGKVDAERVALTPEQATEMSLPYSFDALKPDDPNARNYVAELTRRGYPPDMAVELDAVPPETLEGLTEEAIRRNVDLSAFEDERRQAESELVRLAMWRREVLEVATRWRA